MLMNKISATMAAIAIFLMFAIASASQVVVSGYEDFDEDGMDDWWEYQYFGDLTHEPEEDFDIDGFTNCDEAPWPGLPQGTDPTDPMGKPRPPIGGCDWDI